MFIKGKQPTTSCHLSIFDFQIFGLFGLLQTATGTFPDTLQPATGTFPDTLQPAMGTFPDTLQPAMSTTDRII